MMFTSPSHHQEAWNKVKAATEAGQLGFAAKTTNPASPLARGRRSLVILAYTYDYEDIDDVRRVLVALRELGFVKATLSYKRDADTIDGLYGEGAAIYVSTPGALDFEDRRPEHT